jgi:thiamine pyrophosphate-dependent acetolactate synthase large subunit-like protein
LDSNPPPKDVKIYHIDIDPLNQQIPASFFPAHGHWRADSFLALTQLVDHIKSNSQLIQTLQAPKYQAHGIARAKAYDSRLAQLASKTSFHLNPQNGLNAHNIGNLLRTILQASTTFVLEAITNADLLYDQIQPDRPGSWLNCGGAGIGWSNGAALDVKMALMDTEKEQKQKDKPSLVCHIVGDGSFICDSPSSALWIPGKYKIPIVTVILNNEGKYLKTTHNTPVFTSRQAENLHTAPPHSCTRMGWPLRHLTRKSTCHSAQHLTMLG